MKRYIKADFEFQPWKTSDFTIRGDWHNGRLQGQQGQYRYQIYFGNDISPLETKGGSSFTSKAKASDWLRKFLKEANAQRKDMYDDGFQEILDFKPQDFIDEFMRY